MKRVMSLFAVVMAVGGWDVHAVERQVVLGIENTWDSKRYELRFELDAAECIQGVELWKKQRPHDIKVFPLKESEAKIRALQNDYGLVVDRGALLQIDQTNTARLLRAQEGEDIVLALARGTLSDAPLFDFCKGGILSFRYVRSVGRKRYSSFNLLVRREGSQWSIVLAEGLGNKVKDLQMTPYRGMSGIEGIKGWSFRESGQNDWKSIPKEMIRNDHQYYEGRDIPLENR